MNQTTISPNNKDTLLLVAVPKDSYGFRLFQGETKMVLSFLTGNNVSQLSLKPLCKEVIGLSQNMTEEQAKELVFYHPVSNGYKVYNENRNGGQSQPWFRTAIHSLKSLIESSGLTIGKDQDCLILKIN